MITNNLDQIYMTAEDETEETLILAAMLENLSLQALCATIDSNRNAGCGFARAARIFALNYIRAFLDHETWATHDRFSIASAMQHAMLAVANDEVCVVVIDQPPIDRR